jgi:TonB family protein
MATFDQPGATADVPRLLVELDPRASVFFSNLRDFLFPRRLPPLDLSSAPAAFWPDVFVNRRLPWFSFLESTAYHVIAFALFIAIAHFLALHPAPVAAPAFDHSQVLYYEPSEYLPPLDTRIAALPESAKADPVYAPQPIVSVPPQADNRSQTIVTPPNIKLKQHVPLPNMIAWSDKETKPELAIPPVPLTPAAEITRLAPRVDTSVVTPPPDVQISRTAPAFSVPQAAIVAPPPALDPANVRTVGELNIAPSEIIAPAPQLLVPAQRTVAGGPGVGNSVTPQVVPPPPSLGKSGEGTDGQSYGSPARVVALSLHPAVDASPIPPAGNRRGSFAAGRDGKLGASGNPGSSAGTGVGRELGGRNGSAKGSQDLPSGLYVGSARATTSAVAGDPAKPEIASAANPSSNVPAARVSPSGKPATPDSAAKLSDAERAVFGDRKFYSLTLNMPNLNSAGGSWVIRFAPAIQDENLPKADLSQPFATRKVDPGYPSQLMRENVSGTVILYALIRADGTVSNVRVLRGVDDRLDRYAKEAVAQWKFEPATRNGQPVEVEATFKIPFRPPKNNF